MSFRYNVIVQPLDGNGIASGEPIDFNVSNHDDFLVIMKKVKDADVVSESEAAEFTIGLKLFSEILIRHRQEVLFEQLWPHFGSFMKRLKIGRERRARPL